MEITELEMSLDDSNKGNAQMKNTIMRLTEFEVAYKKMTDNYTKSTAAIKDYDDNEKKLIRLANKLKDELRKLAIAIGIATASMSRNTPN